jgi:hypothetical protein
MSSTKTNTVISVLIFLMINSFIISLGDFYFFTFHAAAGLGAKPVKHQDKQTTRRNYAFPVYVRIRGAARGTGHAATAPAIIRTSCMLCRCAWDW